ncbi:MAG TPA: hypothetical protein VID72_12095, partial [Ktedonobacterales bacterium]
LTIIAFYYPLAPTTWVWSPAAILWNALVSAFPHAPAVNAWFIGRAMGLVAVSALYLGAALAVAGLAVPIVRGSRRGEDVSRFAWALLVGAVWAGILALVAWLVIPYIYEFSDGSNVDIRFTDGTIGIALAIAGAALAAVSLLAIAENAPPREGLVATER